MEPDFEPIFRALVSEPFETYREQRDRHFPALRETAEALGMEPLVFLDAFAAWTARAFLDGRVAYCDADHVANRLWVANLDWAIVTEEHTAHRGDMAYTVSKGQSAELANDVYFAFDAGEYRRWTDSDDVDPVEAYTRPVLLRFFAGLETRTVPDYDALRRSGLRRVYERLPDPFGPA